MRWTVRARLLTMVALTVVATLLMGLVDVFSVQEVKGQLVLLEGDYLPMLDFGPRFRSDLAGLNRRLREAVAAQDPESVEEATGEFHRLLARLGDAPSVVTPEERVALAGALEEWFALASQVSTRLMEGETGEALVRDIEQMQDRQRRVEAQVERALVLDERKLAEAFVSIESMNRWALWARMVPRILLLVLIILLALGVARKIVRGLDALTAGFGRFGRGEFTAAIPVAGQDELSDVARHANRMAENLKEATQTLRQRTEELEHANKELEAFSYSASHDLRTPLRAIDGFSHALEEDFGDRLPAEGKVFLQRIRAGAQRMAQLIDDLLQLSRITRAELDRIPVDLSQVALEVGEGLAGMSPHRRVDFRVQPGLTAEGDPRLLRVVLENLLSNAWKFTAQVPAPRVELGAEEVEGQRAFFVRDNGAGFDMAYASKLFAPFERLHGGEFPGTGIGLATVQRVVHRHGGRVWAEAAPGKGATIRFTLG